MALPGRSGSIRSIRDTHAAAGPQRPGPGDAEAAGGATGRSACRVGGRRPAGYALPRRRHFPSELDHRHRVVAGPVVARDHVEVARAGHVGRGGAAVLQFDQRQGASGVRLQGDAFRRQGAGAALLHSSGGEAGQDVGREQLGQAQAAFVEGHGVMGGQPAHPAVGLEVVGHRADRIGRAVEQVDAAVAVEIHRPARPAGGHELAHAHGARVAAAQGEGVGANTVGQRQELLQFAPEEGLPLRGAWVRGRKIEGQRGERVHHAEAAHVLAVERFHAQDADDDRGRHAVFALGARECVGMLVPEANARADAHGLHEARAVGGPVLGGAPGGRQHEARHLRQEPGLPDGLPHPFAVQPAALGEVVGEAQGLGPLRVQHFRRGLFLLFPGGFLGQGGRRQDQGGGAGEDEEGGGTDERHRERHQVGDRAEKRAAGRARVQWRTEGLPEEGQRRPRSSRRRPASVAPGSRA